MNGKDYLMQAVMIRRQIFHIRQRCEELRTKLGYHPLQLDDTGASKASVTDKVGDTLAELCDWSKEYESQVTELHKKLDEISGKVDQMDNPRYAELIHWRYLTENRQNPTKQTSWITIAYKMGLSNERAAITMHGRALKDFEKKFMNVT